MKTTSGSHYMLKHSLKSVPQQPPASKRAKLEDLINELVSQEENAISASDFSRNPLAKPGDNSDLVHSQANPPEQSPKPFSSMPVNFESSTASPKRALPPDLYGELRLPATPEGVFQGLQSFQKLHRNRPLVELASGRLFYIEYDIDMERIRVFLGNRKNFVCMPRSARELSGFFVIEELYEFKLQTQHSEFLGFSRTHTKVIERYRKGTELLNAREIADARVQPLLYFTLFNECGSGISVCSVKAEHINT